MSGPEPVIGRTLTGGNGTTPYVPSRSIRIVGDYYTVYEATQRGLDRPVELRLLHDRVDPSSPRFQRFAYEMKTLARLDHPSIMRILDMGALGDRFFYVTDLRQARSLKDLITERHRFDPLEVLDIARSLGRALEHMHARKVLHRHLSTASVHLDLETEVPYISDFTLVKNLKYRNLTRRGIPHMTSFLRTPEAIWGRPADERTDLYQLGLVLFELLTGRAPPSGPGEPDPGVEVAMAMADADVPDELIHRVKHLLEPDPALRPGSAQEFLVALEEGDRRLAKRSMLSELSESTRVAPLSGVPRSAGDGPSGPVRRRRPGPAGVGGREDRTGSVTDDPPSLLRFLPPGTDFAGGRRVPVDELLARLPGFRVLAVTAVTTVLVLGLARMIAGSGDRVASEGFVPVSVPAGPARARPVAPLPAPAPPPGAPLVRVGDQVLAEARIAIVEPTDDGRFQRRFSLLHAWLKELEESRRPAPFSPARLVRARIRYYQDSAAGCRELDGLLERVRDQR